MTANFTSPKTRVVRRPDPIKLLRTENALLRARLRKLDDLYKRRDSGLIRMIRQIEVFFSKFRFLKPSVLG